jgi:hypothetical protein
MKVDLVYPKIPENSDKFHGKCYAFEKYDGTNLHWIWNPQEGWVKFGTRRTQFTLDAKGIAGFQFNHHECRNAPDIFNAKLRDKLTMFFCRHGTFSNYQVTLFTEFHGPKSFAGGHEIDDEHELTIIDVMLNGRLMEPELFLSYFKDFGSARLVYQGKYSGQFAEDVRKGKYNVNEGVVVKGIVDGQVFMTKVKTKDYLKRLKDR